MKKIISFSLWGNNPKYLVGAIKNSILAKTFYEGWTPRFYVHKDVDINVINNLDKIGSEIFIFETDPKWGASLYRLIPINDPNVDKVIFRDCDGRISERESKAVEEWEKSQKNYHIMRDHPYHGSHPILAGMFGCKANCIENIEEKIEKYINSESYHTDQNFIYNHIWPLAIMDNLTHDSIFEKKMFPKERNGLEYVGEPFNEKDEPCFPEHRKALEKTLERK